MRAPTLALLLLAAVVAVCTVAVAVAAADAEPSCDGSSPSDPDSCSSGGSPVAAQAQFDPYLPAPLLDPASAAPRVMHMWTTPLLVSQPKLRDAATFNRVLSKRALEAFEHISKREAKAALAAGAAAAAPGGTGTGTGDAAARGDSAEGQNERFFRWQQEQHSRGLKAEVAYLKLAASPEFKVRFASAHTVRPSSRCTVPHNSGITASLITPHRIAPCVVLMRCVCVCVLV